MCWNICTPGILLIFAEPVVDGEIYASQVRIGQALDNIMSNAVKYTLPNGQILVNCKLGDNLSRVEITDDGIGGTISIESEPGQGTRVIINLPRSEPEKFE